MKILPIPAILVLLTVFPAVFSVAGAAALEIPYLSGRVVDLAGVLDPETATRLESVLARHEQTAGHQVAVLTLASLEGESLEDFSIRVVETWQLGRQGIDDGVLLLVALQERQMRIEVGYGLEGTLTDALSSRILNEQMRPRFRAGDLAGGIEAGVEGILAVLSGAELPAPAPGTRDRGSSGGDNWFFALFAAYVLSAFSRGALGAKAPGAWVIFLVLLFFWGGLAGLFFGTLAGAAVAGLWALFFPAAWIFLHHTARGRARLEAWGNAANPRQGRLRRRGWSSTGGWLGGGGFGGGGFGGGGFGGGGGSFGGGGSSSSW